MAFTGVANERAVQQTGKETVRVVSSRQNKTIMECAAEMIDTFNRTALSSCLIVFALSGCQDTSKLETRIAKVSESIDAQNARLDETDNKHLAVISMVEGALAKNENVVESLNAAWRQVQDQWSSFQQAFSPEIRQELQHNLEIADANSKAIEEIKSVADDLLKTLKQLEAESKQFRDLAEQHAARSKGFDKISEFQQQLSSLQTKIAAVKSDADKAALDARRALSKSSAAESAARRAESLARRRR